MAQALVDCQGKNHPLKAKDFLEAKDGDDERLGALGDESTTGYVNVATAVNCKGSSCEFDYVSFGIVFYDFEAVPVAAKGLTYVSGALTKVDDDDAGDNVAAVSNGQQQSIIHTADLGNDVKETTSTSISALAGVKVKEKIGANMSWSETQSGEDTSISGNDDDGGLDVSSEGWSETTTTGISWGQSWELAGAAGAEQGHSIENQISKAVPTAIELPAHTSAGISHKTSKTTYSQAYQQAIILNYKVAIFAMSGDWSSAGAGGIYDNGLYDKQSLVIKFDTRDEADPTYGCAATDDLYSRVVDNRQIGSYDTADGRTYDTHSTASRFSKSTDINWDAVINQVRDWYGQDVANDLARKNWFYETPGKLAVVQDKTSLNVESISPLYGLASVTTPKTKYLLHSNDTLSRDSLTVEGLNKYGVKFYDFKASWGEWNRCDENGNVINGGYLKSDDPVRLENGSTLVPKSGTRGGTIYMTWKIEDATAKPITGESPEGQNLAASNISSPVVEIEVVDSALDDPAVTVSNNSLECFYKTPLVLTMWSRAPCTACISMRTVMAPRLTIKLSRPVRR